MPPAIMRPPTEHHSRSGDIGPATEQAPGKHGRSFRTMLRTSPEKDAPRQESDTWQTQQMVANEGTLRVLLDPPSPICSFNYDAKCGRIRPERPCDQISGLTRPIRGRVGLAGMGG